MPARPKKKHPVRRFAKGRDSESRIIGAALEVFGIYSFDGATTRMIADHGGVNLGSITYYFGNKQGLYDAVARYVADELNSTLEDPMKRARELLTDNASAKSELIDSLNDIFAALAERSVGSADSTHVARFIIREQLDPTTAFDILYDQVMLNVNDVTSQLVSRILGKSRRSKEILVRVSAILGQFIIFEAARELIMRSADWKEYTPPRFELIQKITREHTTTLLEALSKK